jgi:pilus assembly protein CpaB
MNAPSTRTAIVLSVAVGTAAIASYSMYYAIKRISVREVEIARVYTVVAAEAIPIGTMLTADRVKLVAWPARDPIPDSFVSIDKVVDRGVVAPLAKNEPLTEAKLAPIGSGAGLPPTIPNGMRAISVKVNEVIGVAGFVVPGTHVDVVATINSSQGRESMARVVVSNLRVLSAGTRYDQEKSKTDGKPIQTTVVTLAATPDDAERIALASNEGKITLILRNPLDTMTSPTVGIKIAGLLGSPARRPPVERYTRKRVVMAALPPPPPGVYTVEAIRAAKRSEETVR